MVLEEHAVGDLRGASAGPGANLLPANEQRFVHGQPDIPHDAAVMPPVVPDVAARVAQHGPARNGRDAGLVIDGDRQEVQRLQMRRHIEEVGRVAAFVASERRAVEPYLRTIESRPQVKLDALAWGSGEGFEVPRPPQELLVFPDIPGVWHGNRLRAGRQCAVPAGRLALLLRIHPEAPVLVQIDLGRGACQRQQPAERG